MNKLKIGHLPGFKPPAVPNTKREKAWQAWQEEVRRRPVPGRHSGEAVIIQLERSSGLFTSQHGGGAEAQRIVDGLKVYRGYTPEEIAANEGIFWDYALALRRLEDEAEMRRHVE